MSTLEPEPKPICTCEPLHPHTMINTDHHQGTVVVSSQAVAFTLKEIYQIPVLLLNYLYGD